MGTPDDTDDDGHQGTVYDLLFSPDGKLLASRGSDKTIRLWSIPDGREVQRLPGDRLLAFSPDGSKILLGEPTLNNPSTQLWDTAEGKEIWSHPGLWEHAAFNRDGTQIRYIYRGRINQVVTATMAAADNAVIAPPAAMARMYFKYCFPVVR